MAFRTPRLVKLGLCLLALVGAQAASAADYAVVTTNLGRLVFRLNPDIAPLAVRRFKQMVRQRRYDGVAVYRLFPRAFAQAGIGYDEAMVEPRIGQERITSPHNVRGALGFARQNLADAGSGTTEIYWCLSDLPELDKGGFTTFAQLVSGFDVLDQFDNVHVIEHFRYWGGDRWVPDGTSGSLPVAWHAPITPIRINTVRIYSHWKN
jgi:cyclophilin family peptidyl-prolyl cis-trans isomerase